MASSNEWMFFQHTVNEQERADNPAFSWAETATAQRMAKKAAGLLGKEAASIEVPEAGRPHYQRGRHSLTSVLRRGMTTGILLREGIDPEDIDVKIGVARIAAVQPTQSYYDPEVEVLPLPPVLLLYRGKLKVVDGHHRIVKAEAEGNLYIKALVLYAK